MKDLSRWKTFCDYLAGSADELPPGCPKFFGTWWWRGIWWGVIAGAILLFCGQTSKFIYIDF